MIPVINSTVPYSWRWSMLVTSVFGATNIRHCDWLRRSFRALGSFYQACWLLISLTVLALFLRDSAYTLNYISMLEKVAAGSCLVTYTSVSVSNLYIGVWRADIWSSLFTQWNRYQELTKSVDSLKAGSVKQWKALCAVISITIIIGLVGVHVAAHVAAKVIIQHFMFPSLSPHPLIHDIVFYAFMMTNMFALCTVTGHVTIIDMILLDMYRAVQNFRLRLHSLLSEGNIDGEQVEALRMTYVQLCDMIEAAGRALHHTFAISLLFTMTLFCVYVYNTLIYWSSYVHFYYLGWNVVVLVLAIAPAAALNSEVSTSQ